MDFLLSYAKKLYRDFKGEILPLPSRVLAILCCAGLFLLPLLTSDPYLLTVLTFANIYALYAASWDLLAGYVGQLSLGHAAFFGSAAYAAAILNLNFGYPPWVTLPLAGIIAVLAGLVVGVPCLRLRGPYLALATLAFPLVLLGVVQSLPGITGGTFGLSGIDRLSSSFVDLFYYSLILMFGGALVMWKITDSWIGVIFHSIREDEVAAKVSGVNTTKYKLIAFSISALFAGIAGGYYAHFIRVVGPSTLGILISFQAVIWTVFGGIATIYGPIAGTYILYVLTEFLGVATGARMLVFGIMITLVLLFMPEGLFTWIRDKIEEECDRCGERNFIAREKCRVCGAPLRTES